MRRPHPFVLPAKRPTDVRPSVARPIGPADIVVVNGDSVHVCRMDMASGLPRDGASLSLCRYRAADEATGPAADLCATRVGDVLMLWVE